MRIVRSTARWTAAFAAAFAAVPLQAQTTKMPSTLRWGMGHVDIPSASALPHLSVVPTVSGYWVNLENNPVVDITSGQIVGNSGSFEKFYQDASVTVGLFDRVDVGVTLHSLDDEGSGNMIGGFAQALLLKPSPNGGIGVAVGVRAATPADYEDGIDQMPNRLGIPDRAFREDYTTTSEEVSTIITPYAVASAFLKGFETGFLPDHDFTFSLGWGNGTFKQGDFLPWYSFVDSEGWFAGGTLHLGLTESALLNLSADWNGFDLNAGAQVDLNGIRVGAHVMGVNYMNDVSVYRSRKFGLLGSVALCPTGGSMLCRAQLIERPAQDTIRLPAPPPDTITITREVAPALPTGQASTICLATGTDVQVLVTAQGDTLVGPSRTSIRTLRQGGVVFAGDYAQGRTWFEDNSAITFENASYQKSGTPVRLNCPEIMRVGENMGVPVFAMRSAARPYQQLYVPVSPGVWQMYENLRGTRGD